MTKRPVGHTLAVTVVSLLAGMCVSVARGEENAAAVRIEAMANLLAKAQRLSVAVDYTYDVVQDSGQKIEFGEHRAPKGGRPDRAHFEITRRDGLRRGLSFDVVYTVVPAPTVQ